MNHLRWTILLIVTMNLAACGSSQQTLVATLATTPVLPESKGEFPPSSIPLGAPRRLGANHFVVKISGIETLCEPQIRDDACWAACASAVLRHARVKTSQVDLLNEFGSGHADELQLVMALAADRSSARRVQNILKRVDRDENGELPSVTLASHSFSTDALVESVARGEAIVVGIQQPGSDAKHLRVVYGAEFAESDPAAEPKFGERKKDSSGKPDTSTSGTRKTAFYVRYPLIQLHCYDPLPSRGHVLMNEADIQNELVFIINRQFADPLLKQTAENWEEARKEARRAAREDSGDTDVIKWVKDRF